MSRIVYYRIILIFISIMFTACPDPPDTTDCGDRQVKVNGECECEEGYHWSENETKCSMDTTSHNFVWEIETLGGSGSYLNDVAIVDEDDIWVVGNIETDSGEYNAAHWNGDEWKLLEIYSNTLDLYSIQYFADDDIWVLSSYPIHWDGNEWTHYHLTNMGIIPGGLRGEIWGVSSDDIYFVGAYGRIVHYDGSTFTKVESGTDYNIRDIWGVTNEITGNSTIMMVASNLNYTPQYKQIIQLQDGDITYMNDDGLPNSLSGLWFDSWSNYFIVGAGVFEYNEEEVLWEEDTSHPSYPYKEKINGTVINNLFIVGAFGHISHYNGLSWKHYWSDGEVPNFYGLYKNVYVSENMVAAVGWKDGNGIIIRGTQLE